MRNQPAYREPDLPPTQASALRATLLHLSAELRYFNGTLTDPRVGRIAHAPPSVLFALLDDQVREICQLARQYRTGTQLRDGAERTSWQGRAAAGADDALVARFSAQCGAGSERVARQASATYDDLQRRATFGLSGVTREAFIRNNLAAAGFDVGGPGR